MATAPRFFARVAFDRGRILNHSQTRSDKGPLMTVKAAHSRAGTGAQSWYRITNRAGSDSAEVFLYNEIGQWGVTANDFVKDLRDVNASTIELHINSPGGEVFDGVAIFNALKSHKATVNVTVDGIAASAASFVAMAGDTVKMARNAQMMIHEGHGICVGNAQDMVKTAELLDKCSDNIADIYAQRAGGTVEQWRSKMRTETWFSADEAVKAGLADEVIGAAKPVRNDWDLSIFNFAGRSAAPDPFLVKAHGDPDHEDGEPEPPAPVAPDPPPDPEPQPESPADEPGFSMSDVAEAVRAAAEIPFDVATFRDVIFAVAINAPAADAPPAPKVAEPAPGPEPAPKPEPAPFVALVPFDPDAFRAAITLVANNAPAPDAPRKADPETPEPDPSIDLPAFRRLIREAKL